MIRHVWSVYCANSVIDKASNNVTLIEVIERIEVGPQSDPDQQMLLPIISNLVTLWSRRQVDTPVRGRVKTQFHDPSGAVMGEWEYDVDLTVERRTRNRARLPGLQVRGSGIHEWRILVWDDGDSAWEEVAAVPIEIVVPGAETSDEEVS